MPLSETDQTRLLRAIELAEGSIGLSDPNPRVGCVLHDAAGQVAGEGFTQQAGGPHAEVMALRDASQAGRSVAGGTAWVSLEPCAHHGRTPPCADALIAAGLARVVVATTDPFAQVAGRGIERLRAAGVVVDLAGPGPAQRAAHELNIGFFSRVLRQRPWVRLKAAASLDGRTALPDGTSQWITGEAARRDGHAWRRRAGALLTGIGTVQQDDPQLDVRLVATHRQPLRVVVDSDFSMSPQARLLRIPGRVLVVGACDRPEAIAALREAGAEVLLLPDAGAAHRRVDLAALIDRLSADGVNELHVEAGATLNAAMLGTGLVDELLLYVAPMLLGPGRDIAALPTLPSLAMATPLRFEDVQPVGNDLRIRARRVGADAFLQA
ncbi:MAG: bifunctional diaminohydroxyphosphoribosylaminopyrimidine deaminase/5-amino-6-(5-phosphoribosylamino)uracil reductase RibD [Aquabacterium sp.]|nr:bifunctional diaminohydroxyphosphoribosylaminopyrimidine deaminase/5-amino-6-(5-phosphoribosylamino)uracil reductase RibD [Aquabacterium sp.]